MTDKGRGSRHRVHQSVPFRIHTPEDRSRLIKADPQIKPRSSRSTEYPAR
jgi:hypothetical protein